VALLSAAVFAGAVGALVAIPALRLSGIYLALGTAAFAIVLDRWIFTLPDFSVFGVEVGIFDQSSVDVPAPDLFGLTFTGAGSQAILSAVVFALLTLVIVAVRRGRAGRRLLAIKDSEAACATLGASILGSKVLVFAAAAAIAGIGGALYGAQAQSISAADFEFVSGLPVFVLSVVGGIATVGGALFAGTALNGALPVIAVLAPALVKFSALLPGGAGVALGRNPNGVVSQWRDATRPLTARPAVWLPMAVVQIGAALVYVAGRSNGVTFLLVVAVAFVGAMIVARDRESRATAPPDGPRKPDMPLEWRGLERPWRPADAEELDELLGVSRSR
jgi:branched-chain amino acid transport system permease protein